MTELKTPVTPQEVQETLADGTHLQVTIESPGIDPVKELVRVKRCPRGEFLEYAAAIMGHNEIEEAAFYIAKPVEFVESLTDESFDAVMQEGRRLNFTRFESWFGRKQDLLRLTKTSSKEVQAAAEMLAQKLALKN